MKPKVSLLSGAAAGLIAALAMTLVLLVLRMTLGVPTPPELVGDRLAALLTIEQFFSLLDRFGGYNGLKQAGAGGVIAGQLAVGALVGGLAVWLARTRRIAPGATIGVVVVGLWIATIAALWPTLDANARGLPPTFARVTTAVGFALAYTTFAVVLYWGLGASFEPANVRRRRLVLGGSAALLTLAVGASLQRLFQAATFGYDGTEYRGPDIQPITPNDRFYSVTKNVVDPEPWPTLWRLEVGGHVERPRTFTLAELRALPASDQETTLMCISNYVGGGLISNAIWRGVLLRDLLDAAGPRPGAVEVVLYGADGYTDTFAIDKGLQPTTLLAFEMNSEPLPTRHGAPVRAITPGLFGEKSVKWLTRVEVVDRDVKGFYEQQGWGPNFRIPIRSSFLVSDLERPFQPDTVIALRGWAFGGDRGVAGVDVSADGGQTWAAARLEYPGSELSWALWTFDWRPTAPGDYLLVARATDRAGGVQTSEYRDTAPEGATGFHSLRAHVTG